MRLLDGRESDLVGGGRYVLCGWLLVVEVAVEVTRDALKLAG